MANIKQTLTTLCTLIWQAYENDTPPQSLLAYANRLDMSSPEGLFIIQQLLTGTPWGTTPWLAPYTLVFRLGEQLEKPLQHSRLRRLADFWTTWAHKTLVTTCGSWHTLLTEAEAKKLTEAGISQFYLKGAKRSKRGTQAGTAAPPA
jgi:hypothetical protein